MKELVIKATRRTVGKKSDVKNLRKAGLVPCNLYGNGTKNEIFTVSAKDLKAITHTPYSHIINIDLEGEKHLAVVHELQFHPVYDNCLHVDFLAVDDKKPIVIDVPIVITGNAEGVKAGGKFFQEVRKIRISAMLANLPDDLSVDITSLQIGKRITAGDLNYENIQIVSPKGTIICAVKATRQSADTPADEAAASAE